MDFIVGPACCSSAAVAGVLAGGRGVPVISWACSAQFLSDKVRYSVFVISSRLVGWKKVVCVAEMIHHVEVSH